MDLYYHCSGCPGEDVWRIRTHGSRPMARTMLGEVRCPLCRRVMVEMDDDGGRASRLRNVPP